MRLQAPANPSPSYCPSSNPARASWAPANLLRRPPHPTLLVATLLRLHPRRQSLPH
jgi:hypothetical protein